MSGAELHSHTTASDGTLAPARVVDLAAEADLEAVAITDHDTMAGVPEAVLQAEDHAIELIPGVEISCERDGLSLHLLAYWPDPSHAPLAEELAKIRQSRRDRAVRMVERLSELGHSISLEKVVEIGGDNPGRRHVAQALVEAGVTSSIQEAFTPDLIGAGGRAYVPKYCLGPEHAVGLVLGARGAPVLAHPGLTRAGGPASEEVIESLADAGLIGIEADHIGHSPSEVESFTALARSLGLVATAGSDCHADPIQMGRRRASMATVQLLRDRSGR